jgi:hypothetical protein
MAPAVLSSDTGTLGCDENEHVYTPGPFQLCRTRSNDEIFKNLSSLISRMGSVTFVPSRNTTNCVPYQGTWSSSVCSYRSLISEVDRFPYLQRNGNRSHFRAIKTRPIAFRTELLGRLFYLYRLISESIAYLERNGLGHVRAIRNTSVRSVPGCLESSFVCSTTDPCLFPSRSEPYRDE